MNLSPVQKLAKALAIGILPVLVALHYREMFWPLHGITLAKIAGYVVIPLILAYLGNHFAVAGEQNPRRKFMWRAIFFALALAGVLLVVVVEKRIDDDHAKEVDAQMRLSAHLEQQVDKLVDIQTRAGATSDRSPIELNALMQQLKDDRERTRIALDSIERRLSQIRDVHKDDLRTRTLQKSRDLLAFLYQHPCGVDSDLARSNPEFMGQIFVECITRMREEYYKTYRQSVVQILNELQNRGLDVSHARGLAEIGWNNTVVERLAVELSQLAERLPKEN